MTPTITTSVRDVLDWLFASSPVGGDEVELPPELERAARLLLLDTLGCAIGGGAKPELRALNAGLAAFEPGDILLPGMVQPLTAPASASWFATAATWDEACEGLARAHGRPGLHAAPVSLALTLAADGSLGDALVALVRGYEVAGRLGERLRIRPGMHVDGTWGTFGAVTAAGAVLGHGPDQVMAAIEAAACQTPASLYLPVAQGSTVRNTYVGEAARRAIALSAEVAAGVTSTSGALDALAELLLDAAADDVGIAPAGEWLLPQGYLKPFAAVRHVHYGAEAARRWRSAAPSDSSTTSITTIELDVYPEAVAYCGNRAPETAIEAQFSLTYGLARMLATGDLGPDAYTAEALTDPEVRRLERLVDVDAVPGRAPDQRYATLRIATTAGDASTVHVDGVIGDADQPMRAEDVTAKFLSYSEWLGPDWPAAAVATAVLDGPLDAALAQAIGTPQPR